MVGLQSVHVSTFSLQMRPGYLEHFQWILTERIVYACFQLFFVRGSGQIFQTQIGTKHCGIKMIEVCVKEAAIFHLQLIIDNEKMMKLFKIIFSRTILSFKTCTKCVHSRLFNLSLRGQDGTTAWFKFSLPCTIFLKEQYLLKLSSC